MSAQSHQFIGNRFRSCFGEFSVPTSRRDFIKYGVAGAVGFGVASAIELPIMNNTVTQNNDQINKLQTALNTALQGQGFLTLNPNERTLVEAIAEAMIPTDSNGPGAKETGVILFIDRMLAGNYGKGGNMYLQGPFVLPQTGSVTVQGSTYPSPDAGVAFPTRMSQQYTYSEGTIAPRLQAGTAYQYAFSPREFWRRGLVYLQAYCNANPSYGKNFEALTTTQQIAVLQDMFDNLPSNSTLQASFKGPNAAEFFNDLHDLVTAGYFTDPLYGGNMGMASWSLLGFNGCNMGNAYGEGYTTVQLMTSPAPIRLKPESLSQLQSSGEM